LALALGQKGEHDDGRSERAKGKGWLLGRALLLRPHLAEERHDRVEPGNAEGSAVEPAAAAAAAAAAALPAPS
jgi:hypothetical protein